MIHSYQTRTVTAHAQYSTCWSHFILKSKSTGCRVRGNVSAGWEGVATELCKYLQLVMVFIMRLIAEDIGPIISTNHQPKHFHTSHVGDSLLFTRTIRS